MPAAKKQGEVENFTEAMQVLGISNPVIPADADTSVIEAEKGQSKETPDPSRNLVQDAKIKQPEIEASESEQETQDEEETEEVPEPEKKRRTWQSEAEKAKQLARQKEEEAETFAQALEIEKQKNNYLMQMLAGFQQMRQPEQQKVAPKQDKEPELWDFIQKDQYDRDDIGDPSTPSGKAYQNWLDARADYRAEKKYQQLEAQRQEQTAREVTFKQAKALADEFPEFKNPFTGQPDIPKIQEWLDGLSKVDWVTLRRALDGNKKAANGQVKALPIDAEIGRRANKPGSVAGQSSATPGSKKVPAEVKQLADIYGNNFVLPKDAAF